MNRSLSIIIINFKTPELTRNCINSIKCNTSNIELEIIVVDNYSQDNSQNYVTSQHPDVIWKSTNYNMGFGRANNLGVQLASKPNILLLNSDIILRNNSIEVCLDYLNNNPNSIIGPILSYPNGRIQKSTYTYIGNYTEILKDNLLIDKIYTFKTRKIQAIMGSFMMMKKSMFELAKGFDEDFFMYCEEIDLCKRMTDLGGNIVQLKNTNVCHIHGASSNKDWVIRQTLLSRSLLVLKHKGLIGLYLSIIFYTFNFFTNLLLMWFLDKAYRKSFLHFHVQFFKVFFKSLSLPFRYGTYKNSNKNFLKAT